MGESDIHPAKNIFTHIGHKGDEEIHLKTIKKTLYCLVLIEEKQNDKNIHYFGNVENSNFTVTSFSVILDYALENESLSDYFSPNKFFEYMNAELTIIGSLKNFESYRNTNRVCNR